MSGDPIPDSFPNSVKEKDVGSGIKVNCESSVGKDPCPRTPSNLSIPGRPGRRDRHQTNKI